MAISREEEKRRKSMLDAILSFDLSELLEPTEEPMVEEIDARRQMTQTLAAARNAVFDANHDIAESEWLSEKRENNNDYADNKGASLNTSKARGPYHAIKTKTSFVRYLGILIMLVSAGLFFWSGGDNEVTSAPSPFASSTAAPPQKVKKLITKNIEDIQKGDDVLAYDVQTGQVAKRKVTSTITLRSDHTRYLTVCGDSGLTQTFCTTDTHPFWVVSKTPDLARIADESVSIHDL